mmetsp:Transcript_3734/g.23483  ORF Transcript_3734/g.23483 Transcript_3734/m.23483 type:complete len:208 (+) Transcript_3734:160-783(+)
MQLVVLLAGVRVRGKDGALADRNGATEGVEASHEGMEGRGKKVLPRGSSRARAGPGLLRRAEPRTIGTFHGTRWCLVVPGLDTEYLGKRMEHAHGCMGDLDAVVRCHGVQSFHSALETCPGERSTCAWIRHARTAGRLDCIGCVLGLLHCPACDRVLLDGEPRCCQRANQCICTQGCRRDEDGSIEVHRPGSQNGHPRKRQTCGSAV